MSLTITNYFIKNMQKYQRIHRDQVDEVGVMNAKLLSRKSQVVVVNLDTIHPGITRK
jgi:hypothetical protein